MEELTFAQKLNILLNEIPNEDPIDYFKYMYKTINVGTVRAAVESATNVLNKEKKTKGCNEANVYLTLGGDSNQRSLFTGFISGLLWLEQYINTSYDKFGVTKEDAETCKRVLRTMKLPSCGDIWRETDEEHEKRTKPIIEKINQIREEELKAREEELKREEGLRHEELKGEGLKHEKLKGEELKHEKLKGEELKHEEDKEDINRKFDEQIEMIHNTKYNATCKHYASFLFSYITWLSTGETAFPSDTRIRSNMELSRFLTNMSLNSFPAIPYTVYYVGTVKTNDMANLAERLHSCFDFKKYMSDESITVNQPQFVVQNRYAPLVGIAGHPLGNIIYGYENNGKTEWYGLFTSSDEFEKICIKNGVSSKDIKKYIYQTDPETHKRNLLKNDPIAQFINSQRLAKEIFETRHKFYDIEGLSDEQYEL